jgi:hypothetical protein
MALHPAQPRRAPRDNTMNTPGGRQVDPVTLSVLRTYKRTKQLTCLECGYCGLMGVDKTHVPWYGNKWLLIPAMCLVALASCGGILFIPVIGLGLFVGVVALFVWTIRSWAVTTYYRCPMCKKLLVQR